MTTIVPPPATRPLIDTPRSILEHLQDFSACGVSVIQFENGSLALQCGKISNLFLIKISKECNSTFYPAIKSKKWEPAHSFIGHTLRYTKKIVTSDGQTWPIFGFYSEEWPEEEGFPSCTLIDNKEAGCKIELLADCSDVLIEPSVDKLTGARYYFHTPLHEDGDPALTQNINSLWPLGIITLHRDNIEEELLPAFGKPKKKKRRSNQYDDDDGTADIRKFCGGEEGGSRDYWKS
jgi:hypothetical protein